MTELATTPWVEEIEGWLDEKGLVYVFRWVPTFAPAGGSRDEHSRAGGGGASCHP